MRVQIDEAWRDGQSTRVDFRAARAPRDGPDCGNPVSANRDVSGEPRVARPVDDMAAADQEIVRRLSSGQPDCDVGGMATSPTTSAKRRNFIAKPPALLLPGP